MKKVSENEIPCLFDRRIFLNFLLFQSAKNTAGEDKDVGEDSHGSEHEDEVDEAAIRTKYLLKTHKISDSISVHFVLMHAALAAAGRPEVSGDAEELQNELFVLQEQLTKARADLKTEQTNTKNLGAMMVFFSHLRWLRGSSPPSLPPPSRAGPAPLLLLNMK